MYQHGTIIIELYIVKLYFMNSVLQNVCDGGLNVFEINGISTYVFLLIMSHDLQ